MTFSQWLAVAARGDGFVYHRGFLLVDTDTGARPYRKAFAAMQRRYEAWRAYECGQVTLVQRRNAPDDYSYIAVRL